MCCQHLLVPMTFASLITILILTENIKCIPVYMQSLTHKHTLPLSLFAFRVNANASGGNRVLKRCHHHSLQEAIIERKLIYCADIPASFLPRAAYPLWVIGNIG